jgi:beta-phosphoglucomutase family hydrolase
VSLHSERVNLSRDQFDAVIFDLDGVITDTASLHFEAWKQLFDEYLAHEAPASAPRQPFSEDDYRRFVDGRPRMAGIEAFLNSRGIKLELGMPDDPIERQTVEALARRKNQYFLSTLAANGATVFRSSVDAVRELQKAGFATAVVTSSRNRPEVLDAVGLGDLFTVHVDGVDAAALGLAGKPDPAPFLEAARRLDVDPARAVVVEDAISGVEAGHRGSFGMVIGVDRGDGADALLKHGADVVVRDLVALEVTPLGGFDDT